jgi:hypothetical protein
MTRGSRRGDDVTKICEHHVARRVTVQDWVVGRAWPYVRYDRAIGRLSILRIKPNVPQLRLTLREGAEGAHWIHLLELMQRAHSRGDYWRRLG